MSQPHDHVPLKDLEYVAFDLETTGLSAASDQIVEFGAIRFHLDGHVLECFEQLVNPCCSIPRRATQIHGITDAMVQHMPTVAETLPEFLAFLNHENTVLMAHNASFDLQFLQQAIAQHGAASIEPPVIDTLQMARRAIQGMYNYRLEHLAISLQLADSEDHRALSDSRLVMGLFRRVLESCRGLATQQQLFMLSPPRHVPEALRSPSRRLVSDRHLALAIAQQRTMIMVYEGGSKGLADRRVTPRRLVRSFGARCLIAYCHTDCVEKTFRLDRIRELRFTP